jgi:hypothetical protein
VPGFDCYDLGQCAVGRACVRCSTGSTGETYLCAPDPDSDPTAYAEATANCNALVLYGTCDGPEDCSPGQYCIFTNAGVPRHFFCSPDPAPLPIDCALYSFPEHPSCTFCYTNSDCPSGQSCSSNVVIGNASGCVELVR